MNELDVTKVFGKGKTTIPSDVRNRWGLSDGDRVVWLEDPSSDQIIVKPSKITGGGRYELSE